MQPTLTVLDAPHSFGSLPRGTMSASDFISGGAADLPPGTIVRNLATDFSYLSRAYYVSLLAEAWGHIPRPNALDLMTFQGKPMQGFTPLTRRSGHVPSNSVGEVGDRGDKLGILFTPSSKFGASSPDSLRDFTHVAHELGIDAVLINQTDVDLALIGFSGLFIRDLTQPDNPAFRTSLRAQSLGLPVLDDPKSIIRCSNKIFIQELLKRHRIPTPRTLLVSAATSVDAIVAEFGLPFVVKLPNGAFSTGVFKAETRREANDLVERLRRQTALLIAQEYMPTDFDWRIGLLDGEPLFACKYIMVDGHWQIIQHLAAGRCNEGEVVSIPLEQVPSEVIATACRAARLVGDGLYGVDLKQKGERSFVVEVNDNPNIDSHLEGVLPDSNVWLRLAKWFARRMQSKAAERCTLREQVA